MTEYKVVCSRDEHHNYNHMDYHYEVTTPQYGCYRHNQIYRLKAQAEEKLAEAIEECAKFDAKHDNDGRDNIRTKQYNFRIMTREVSEWVRC